ncbi:MAG TPA: hypothetical protein VFV50_02070 [Bdellovibrionales bacterium]|nr:hypothetical protein [Bdellovibrionales bacterium]
MKFAMIFFALLLSVTSSRASEQGDRDSIRACLKSWGKHPFKAESPEFRTISASVKVFGIGGKVEDDRKTDEPELVLIKPSVNVFSKGTFRLLNPNGWYCLKGKVAVFSKVEIQLHCKASLASSSDGATILASNDRSDGVTVFGKSEVKKIGCGSGSGEN